MCSAHTLATRMKIRGIACWGGRGEGDGLFTFPVDLVVDREGRVYASDLGQNTIQCFSTDGEFIRKWGGPGVLDWPSGLAIGECDGVSTRALHRMCDIPELGAFPPGLLPICAAYLGNECLYVADRDHDRVCRIQFQDGELRTWIDRDQVVKPISCCVSAQGHLYVSEFRTSAENNHQIKAFDSQGKLIRVYNVMGYGRFRSGLSNGVTQQGYNCMYATFDNGIVRLYPDGTQDCYLHSRTSSFGGIMATNDGNIYVSNLNAHTISIYGLDGKVKFWFGKRGHNQKKNGPQFIEPTAMALDTKGRLLVIDSGNYRIMRIDIVGAVDETNDQPPPKVKRRRTTPTS